jgi:hypothetical protein
MGSLGRKIKLAKTGGTQGSEWNLKQEAARKGKCKNCSEKYEAMSAKVLLAHYNDGKWDTCPK